MALHFAPAAIPGRSPVCSPIAKALAARAIERAANDNDGRAYGEKAERIAAEKRSNDQLMHAALRHFAKHGIGAAREARSQAEAAFFAGDRQAYDWWLGITRTLDRRLAQEAIRMEPGKTLP